MRLGWVLSVLAATPAGAVCVDRMDLERGGLATFESGLVLRLRLAEDGSIHLEDDLESPLGPYRTVLRHGFWPVEAYGVRPDGTPDRETGVVWHYENVVGLPPPQDGLVWSGWTTSFVGGMVRRSDNQLVLVKPRDAVEVAGCVYEALQVLTLVDQATEGPLILRNLFLTDLGVALPWTRAGEDEPRTEVRLVGLEVE